MFVLTCFFFASNFAFAPHLAPQLRRNLVGNSDKSPKLGINRFYNRISDMKEL